MFSYRNLCTPLFPFGDFSVDNYLMSYIVVILRIQRVMTPNSQAIMGRKQDTPGDKCISLSTELCTDVDEQQWMWKVGAAHCHRKSLGVICFGVFVLVLFRSKLAPRPGSTVLSFLGVDDDQAYFSAQQPSSPQGTWLPDAYAYARGALNPFFTSP